MEKTEKNTEFLIRRMTKEDIPQAAEIEKQCFSEPWSENAYRSCFAGDGEQCWFYAAVSGKDPAVLLGIIGLSRMGDDGEISNVAVLPQWRRNGLARALLERAIRDGESLYGLQDFTLEVRAGNQAAIRLYESEGFREEGRRPDFYRNPTEDARILWRRKS